MSIVTTALLLNDNIVDTYVILADLSAVSVFSTLSKEQINSVKSDVLCNIAALGPNIIKMMRFKKYCSGLGKIGLE